MRGKNNWWQKLAVLSLSFFMLLSVACGNKDNTTASSDRPEGMLNEPAPNLSKRPNGLACKLLDHIKDGEYGKAYDMLGSEPKSSFSRESFISMMKNYMSTASTKESFMAREVTNERIYGKTGVVQVTDVNSRNSMVWKWEYQETYGGWELRSLDLPPLFHYKKRFSV